MMQNLNKIKKLINQASSDQPAEAQQSAKMAGAFMVREGVNFGDLLQYKDSLYIDGLMLSARAYAQRTTSTHTEAQTLSAKLYKQINDAYHPKNTKSKSTNQEKYNLQKEREELEKKAKELQEREAEILRQNQEKPKTHPLMTSHNVIFVFFEKIFRRKKPVVKKKVNIANYFLKMIFLHPVLTLRLFVRSLVQALITSFVFMIFIFIVNMIFSLDLTFNLSYLAMYEGLVFVLLISYTLVNINGWYPTK